MASNAWTPHALVARYGPRRNSHAIRRGTPTRAAKNPPSRPRPRGIRAARLEVESGKRRSNQGADDPPGSFLRLDARKVYARACVVSFRIGSVSPALPRRPDLPWPLHGELVPAMPDGH